jgi:hypothetical protein
MQADMQQHCLDISPARVVIARQQRLQFAPLGVPNPIVYEFPGKLSDAFGCLSLFVFQ